MLLRTGIRKACALVCAVCAVWSTGGHGALGQGSDPSVVGQWGPVIATPLVQSVHMVMLKTGNVLCIGSPFADTPNRCRLFYPSTNTVSDVFLTPEDPNEPGMALHNLYCSGHCALGDGRVLFYGGAFLFLTKTTIYDPGAGATGTFTVLSEDGAPRFYPSLTTLSTGAVLAVGGQWNQSLSDANIPAIFDPTGPLGSQWQFLPLAAYCTDLLNCPGFPPGPHNFHIHYYPFNFQLSSGLVLYAGEDENLPYDVAVVTRTLNLATQAWVTAVTQSDDIKGGSAVMYRPDRVLKAGGDQNNIVENRALRLDASTLPSQWVAVDSMNHARRDFYLIALPDGNVLALGGTDFLPPDYEPIPIFEPELLSNPDDPQSTWMDLAPMTHWRDYHSSAVLLPDARVLIGGGTAGPNIESLQVFSPPYLFDPLGGPALRPTIRSVVGPSGGENTVQYGSGFTVVTPGADYISEVNLVRLGAATHSFDQDQRFVPLEDFTHCAQNLLRVSAPPNGNVAPPGHYMLFVLGNGVPAKAKIVRLDATPPCVMVNESVSWSASGCRYLDFTPPLDCPIALYVKGDPNDPRVACVSGYVKQDKTLGTPPFFQAGSVWGNIHLTGHWAIPGATYWLQVIRGDQCDPWRTTTTWAWGDVTPAPAGDGICDVGDVLCELDAFAGIFTNCSLQATDLDPCLPDGMVDLGDILKILDAFAGVPYPCGDPCGEGAGGGGGAAPASSATVRLVPRQPTVKAGGLVTVDIMMDIVTDLRGYNVAADAVLVDGRILERDDLVINSGRRDYIFRGSQGTYSAIDQSQGRAMSALATGGKTTTAETYLATIIFRTATDMVGVVNLSLNSAKNQLRDSTGRTIEIQSAGAIVTIEP